MQFYSGNKLLDRLKDQSFFIVPPAGTWSVIYADENNQPLMNLVVHNSAVAYENNKNILPTTSNILSGTLIVIGPDTFWLKWDMDKKHKLYTGDSLFLEFKSKNLVLSQNYQGKPFNSKASSYYHLWQSKQRFVGGIVDIDLFRLNKSNLPVELIEIKRSRIAINTWQPYLNDKGGYEILERFCIQQKLQFSIIYYHYDPKNEIEDIDQLLIFKKTGEFKFNNMGIFSLKSFINGEYDF
jgi:hypothetical protein